MPERHTIVCLSSQNWSDPLWTNKQHIMSRLAREHRVLHVDFSPFPLMRLARHKLTAKPALLRHPLELLLRPLVSENAGVSVLDFYAPRRLLAFPHGNPLRVWGNFDLRVWQLQRYLRAESLLSPIVWVYHPGFGAEVMRLPHKLVVYDCVDEYRAFPEFRGRGSWVAERERQLCRGADLVFTTSRALYDAKRPLNPSATHLVHNVGDAEHFKTALLAETRVPDEIRDLPKPIIGFVGAVSDYKLNADWVLHLAQTRPEWSIVLVGPTGVADPGTDTRKLDKQPNVHLLGKRDYGVLPGYLKGFDVAVIPYRLNDYTRAVFPIKFFEFLASGTPVVISRLPALEEFYDVVGVAGDAEGFVRECDHALRDSPAAKSRRVALAEQHSWPARIGRLMSLIDEKLASTPRPA